MTKRFATALCTALIGMLLTTPQLAPAAEEKTKEVPKAAPASPKPGKTPDAKRKPVAKEVPAPAPPPPPGHPGKESDEPRERRRTIAPPLEVRPKKEREESPSPTVAPPPTGAIQGQVLPEIRKDLAVEEVLVSSTELRAGDPFQVTLVVRNLGDAQIAQATFRIFLVQNLAIFPLLEGSVSHLRPGVETAVKRQVVIPLNATIPLHGSDVAEWYGETEVWGIIDSAKSIDEEDEHNNGTFTKVDLVAVGLPDLSVTRFELQGDQPEPGELFDVEFTIENVGPGPSVASGYASWFKRSGPVDRHSSAVVGEHYYEQGEERLAVRSYDIYPLEPDEALDGSLRFRMPEGTGWANSGTFKVTITIDRAGALNEEDTENNTREIRFVRPVPDP